MQSLFDNSLHNNELLWDDIIKDREVGLKDSLLHFETATSTGSTRVVLCMLGRYRTLLTTVSRPNRTDSGLAHVPDHVPWADAHGSRIRLSRGRIT